MAKILKNINRERQPAPLDPHLSIANNQQSRGEDRKLKRNQVKVNLKPLATKEAQPRTARLRSNEQNKNVVNMFHNFDAYSNVS